MSPKTNLSAPPSPSPINPLHYDPHFNSTLSPPRNSETNTSTILFPHPSSQAQDWNWERGHVSVRSKRKLWLDTHPEYFETAEEGAERDAPLQHDTLIRRFQTAAERAGRGYAVTLEADLWRAEAKRAAAMGVQQHHQQGEEEKENRSGDEDEDDGNGNGMPRDKEEGQRMWREVMEKRFLEGRDDEFEYGVVDDEEKGEGEWEERERVERWFEEEEEDGEGVGTGVLDF